MPKLNFILFSLSFLFFLSTSNAQKHCMESPEGLGKHIGDLLLSQKDISKEPFYTDEVNTTWNSLLKTAKEHEMVFSTYNYDKTYFSFNNSDSKLHYTLYIAFKNEKDNCAIRLELIKKGELWSIKEFYNEFYTKINPRKNIERFISKKWVLENDKTYPVINKEKPFKLSKNNAVDCYTSPTKHLQKYIEELLTSTNMASSPLITSLQEYKKAYIPSMLKLLNKIKTDKPRDIEEIAMIKQELIEFPEKNYEERFVKNINTLSNYIQSEGYTKAHIDTIEFAVKNFENEVIGDGSIICRGDIVLKKGDTKEGIYCISIWYNNTWKIVNQQKYTYGISDAVNAED